MLQKQNVTSICRSPFSGWGKKISLLIHLSPPSKYSLRSLDQALGPTSKHFSFKIKLMHTFKHCKQTSTREFRKGKKEEKKERRCHRATTADDAKHREPQTKLPSPSNPTKLHRPRSPLRNPHSPLLQLQLQISRICLRPILSRKLG